MTTQLSNHYGLFRKNLSVSVLVYSFLVSSHSVLNCQEAIENMPRHKVLETELEIYPFNIIVPSDPVIKNEAMFDFHDYSEDDKRLGGIRFFADANTHWEKPRDMQDLILYTEFYFGFRNFQLGVETGSVTGQEYLSVGPQLVHYDGMIFKRISVISRVFPDYVVGYEFTTREAKIFRNTTISSTGMGRLTMPTNQAVMQISAWISFKRAKHVYIGIEYEFNNAKHFNQYNFETRNELFWGLKFELH